jgi:hypothetical protein
MYTGKDIVSSKVSLAFPGGVQIFNFGEVVGLAGSRNGLA